MEKLASNTHMYVSMPSETQITLIILHGIIFSFPNLALVHALTAAHRELLLFIFKKYPSSFRSCWLEHELGIVHKRGVCCCAHRLLREADKNQLLRQLGEPAHPSHWHPLAAPENAHGLDRASRRGAVGGCERQPDSTARITHAGDSPEPA